MDRYPGLRAAIKEEFGSIYQFCRETDTPQATVKHLILGNLGKTAETNAVERVDGLFMKFRPELNRAGLWIRQDPQQANNLVVKIPPGTTQMRVNVAVDFKFE